MGGDRGTPKGISLKVKLNLEVLACNPYTEEAQASILSSKPACDVWLSDNSSEDLTIAFQEVMLQYCLKN